MRSLIAVLLLNIVLLLTSCEKQPSPVYEPEIDFSNNKKASALISADNAFAFELMKEVDSFTGEENYMISPLSVSIALGMTMNGAEGSTEDAFVNTLGFEGMSPAEINYIHGHLIEHLQKVDPKVTLKVANSIWVNQMFTLLQEFADTNKHYYDSEIRNLDFNAPDAKDIINQWVEDKTQGKIKDVLDYIPSSTVMYLINALYFNGNWKYEFEEDPEFRIDFMKEDGTSEDKVAMKMESDLEVYVNQDLAVVDLPYGDDKYSMVLLLPGENKTSDDLISALSLESWVDWMAKLNKRGVRLEMPKFKHGFKVLLNEPLTYMGLGEAFSPSARFPDMVEESQSLMISRVIHQTFIDVNEKGTEAAAVTVVEIRETSAIGGGSGPMVIRLDKPFLYVIREKSSNAIVFMGKIGNPEIAG